MHVVQHSIGGPREGLSIKRTSSVAAVFIEKAKSKKKIKFFHGREKVGQKGEKDKCYFHSVRLCYCTLSLSASLAEDRARGKVDNNAIG